MSIREVKEGLQIQGLSAQRRYTITIPTTWGTPSGTPTVTAYDESDWSAVSNVLSGSASVASQVITTPLVQNMRQDKTYRVVVVFSIAGGVEDVYFRVRGER